MLVDEVDEEVEDVEVVVAADAALKVATPTRPLFDGDIPNVAV